MSASSSRGLRVMVGSLCLRWGARSLVTSPRVFGGGPRGASRGVASAAASTDFQRLFDGDFDNYAQISVERLAGVVSADPTGHEHVHCALRGLADQYTSAIVGGAEAARSDYVVLACYYLDADPEKVFRLRAYALRAAEDVVTMRLYRPPLASLSSAHAAAANLPSRGVAVAAAGLAALGPWELLEGCDVNWRRNGAIFEGKMDEGGCTIQSQFNASRTMLIKDELTLREDALWVDDRGYDGDTGDLVYGSVDGTPYKMDRVSLEWTINQAAARRDQSLNATASTQQPASS